MRSRIRCGIRYHPPPYQSPKLYLPNTYRIIVPLSNVAPSGELQLIGYIMSGGLFIGTIITLFIASIQRRRNASTNVGVGEFSALYPRNKTERLWGILLSISAGVTEELMFRLTLPLLLFIATGNFYFAIAFSIFVFGLMHLYQGFSGAAATATLAILLTAIDLFTGNLFFAMALHIWVDMNRLILVPLSVTQSVTHD